MSNMTVEQKFAKVLIHLRKLAPFYSALYETVPKIETTRIETMGVTVDKLYYNPRFVESITIGNLVFVLLHELAHIGLMHPTRVNNRDPRLFNVACDLYINKLLMEELGDHLNKAPLMISPTSGYLYDDTIDTNFDYVEKIYDNLKEQAKENGYDKNGTGDFKFSQSDGNWHHTTVKEKISKDDFCDVMDNGEDRVKQDNDAKRIVQEAVTKFEMSGEEPGTANVKINRLIKEILKSKVDWRKLLKKYCIQMSSTDTSFKRPDKRMFYQDAIYPGVSSDNEYQLKDVKICIDTSGSISEIDLKYIIGQINDITKEYKVESEIMCWDTVVQTAYSLEDASEIMRKGLTGGGGTTVNCIFDYMDSKKCRIKPKVTLVFTDGFFSLDNIKPSWKKRYKDTIWVMTKDYNKDFIPPFGRMTIAKFE